MENRHTPTDTGARFRGRTTIHRRHVRWLAALIGVVSLFATGVTIANAEITLDNPTKMAAVGPVSSVHGYPVWYEDSKGLRLTQCLDLDEPLCDPAFLRGEMQDPDGEMSFPDNWPVESFYMAADANMPIAGGVRAGLTLALEATFSTETPAAGDQMVFGRLRIRVDTPVAGEYVVTHPYGVDTFVIADDPVAIADGINYTQDIGLRTFAEALDSRINPFLVQDPDENGVADIIVQPDGDRFIGNPLNSVAVVGSPFQTNFFRVQGPAGSGIGGTGVDVQQTELFNLMGKVATNNGLEAGPATYTTDGTTTYLDVFAQAGAFDTITVSGAGVPSTSLLGDGTGRFFGRVALADGVARPTTVSITNASDVPAESKTVPVTDLVVVTSANYDSSGGSLVVTATSSDTAAAPVLTMANPNGGADLTLSRGVVEVTGLAAPPPAVTIRSSVGGADTAPVVVTGDGSFAPAAAEPGGGGGIVAQPLAVTLPNPSPGLNAVGPVSSVHGFPVWYEDSNRLRLEQCLDLNEPLCDPGFLRGEMPRPNDPMSFPDNWPLESFYTAAEATFNTGARVGGRAAQALLVMALEATFTGEEPAAGDQLVFNRMRFRIDVPNAGTFKVIHPYGEDTFTVAAGGRRAINVTEDVGIESFEAVVEKSRMNPFLIQDPDGNGVADMIVQDDGDAFVGNPAVTTRVVGSPLGTNVFRIEGPNIGGPGVNAVQTDLFTLMGKVSNLDGVEAQRATYTEEGESKFVDVFATTPGVNDALFVSWDGMVDPMPLNGNGAGQFFTRVAVTDVPAEVTITNSSDNPPSMQVVPVTDLVVTGPATYDSVNEMLTVAAVSSDTIDPLPTLRFIDPVIGAPLADGTVSAPTAAPPSAAAVASDFGGSDAAPVVVAGDAVLEPDPEPPVVTLTTPAAGAELADTTPTFGGTAGILPADIPEVTVDIHEGADATGAVVQTLTTTAGPDGAFTVDAPTALANGTYTAVASQQSQNASGVFATGTSAPVTFSVGVTALTRFEETAPEMVFAGAWTELVGGGRSGGAALASTAAGDSMTVRFEGSVVRLIATTAASRGTAQVSIDNGAPNTINLFSADTLFQQVVFEASGLSPGEHTLTVTVNGVTVGGTADWVEIDAVEAVALVASVTPQRFEETHPLVEVSDDWTELVGGTRSGGAATASNIAGQTLTVNFDGPVLRIIGTTAASRGIGSVSIDGVVQSVDWYSPTTLFQQVVFERSDLEPGPHSMVVTVTGTMGPEATATWVEVDAIEAFGLLPTA